MVRMGPRGLVPEIWPRFCHTVFDPAIEKVFSSHIGQLHMPLCGWRCTQNAIRGLLRVPYGASGPDDRAGETTFGVALKPTMSIGSIFTASGA